VVRTYVLHNFKVKVVLVKEAHFLTFN
jgi:hypothetical protein